MIKPMAATLIVEKIDDYVGLINQPGLEVTARTDCFRVRHRGRSGILVGTDYEIMPGQEFTVEGLFEAALNRENVVAATLSVTLDAAGKEELAVIRASHIKRTNPSRLYGNTVSQV